ncbi:MAG: VOC family protein [Nevskia sp.]|nr:VOC family protein [Nevskia sp.]
MIASLTVRSAELAIAFYQSAFGFELEFIMPGPDGRVAHAQMTFHDGRIMFSPEGAYGSELQAPASSGREGPMQQYVYCPDVDALTERARNAGATVVSEPAIMFWGDRMATFLDPDGYRWAFATNVAEFDPAQMPDAGYAAQT